MLFRSPDRRGRLHDEDVASLRGFRKLLDEAFSTNLSIDAKTVASTFRGNASVYSPCQLTDGSNETYWATDDNVSQGWVEIILPKKTTVHFVLLQEYIALGQRVKSFSVNAWKEDQWQPVMQGTTIGYKRILEIEPIETDKVRINFTSSKASLVISNIALY